MGALAAESKIGVKAGPPYKAKAIANYFLDLAEKDRKPLSHMKVQKLVYFAHGWHLALYKMPLIDERVQAWEFGPVIRTLYDEFKVFGREAINARAESMDFKGTKIEFFQPEVSADDTQTRRFLDRIWEVYEHLTAYQLSTLTHRKDTPWDKAYSANPGVRNLTIEDNDIKSFFENRAHANRERRTAG